VPPDFTLPMVCMTSKDIFLPHLSFFCFALQSLYVSQHMRSLPTLGLFKEVEGSTRVLLACSLYFFAQINNDNVVDFASLVLFL
jgi:hypothetical protein